MEHALTHFKQVKQTFLKTQVVNILCLQGLKFGLQCFLKNSQN